MPGDKPLSQRFLHYFAVRILLIWLTAHQLRGAQDDICVSFNWFSIVFSILSEISAVVEPQRKLACPRHAFMSDPLTKVTVWSEILGIRSLHNFSFHFKYRLDLVYD